MKVNRVGGHLHKTIIQMQAVGGMEKVSHRLMIMRPMTNSLPLICRRCLATILLK